MEKAPELPAQEPTIERIEMFSARS